MKTTWYVPLTSLLIATSACVATTQGQEAAERPGPAMAFDRLDRDQDGKVKLDEIPAAVPVFMKRMLENADKNGDGTVTTEEFAEAARAFRSRAPMARAPAGGQGPGRSFGAGRAMPNFQAIEEDMLTPAYYLGGDEDPFKREVDRFLAVVRQQSLHHPLEDKSGKTPDHSVPMFGMFGVGKGPDGTTSHHPAIDLRVGTGETEVNLYAAHDGVVHTVRDAPKYRHYVSVAKTIKNDQQQVIGKLVTLYGHVDLDLDEAASLSMDGRKVKQGELISRHLYAETRGGPHLHFEVRYYRKGDAGTVTFYGDPVTARGATLTESPAGPWSHGLWNPDVGYGFGHPKHHGLVLMTEAAKSPQGPFPQGARPARNPGEANAAAPKSAE